ncbi:hypothetical protein Baya_3178 [Bagarius yarrelli]|uniref:Uncharacterized protein n=1 Tax=Bagarius yarrelli TaxID=175774 RepID=A0A556TUN2_BAGYA|nr:hypothetical protein Baya_3178 [Bagarius yarrelli]
MCIMGLSRGVRGACVCVCDTPDRLLTGQSGSPNSTTKPLTCPSHGHSCYGDSIHFSAVPVSLGFQERARDQLCTSTSQDVPALKLTQNKKCTSWICRKTHVALLKDTTCDEEQKDVGDEKYKGDGQFSHLFLVPHGAFSSDHDLAAGFCLQLLCDGECDRQKVILQCEEEMPVPIRVTDTQAVGEGMTTSAIGVSSSSLHTESWVMQDTQAGGAQSETWSRGAKTFEADERTSVSGNTRQRQGGVRFSGGVPKSTQEDKERQDDIYIPNRNDDNQ